MKTIVAVAGILRFRGDAEKFRSVSGMGASREIIWQANAPEAGQKQHIIQNRICSDVASPTGRASGNRFEREHGRVEQSGAFYACDSGLCLAVKYGVVELNSHV